MPRRKKTETSVENSVTVEAVSDAKVDNSLGPNLFKRDKNGLLTNIQYDFNEDGSVNWRSMIKEEYLFPNKSFFELNCKGFKKILTTNIKKIDLQNNICHKVEPSNDLTINPPKLRQQAPRKTKSGPGIFKIKFI